MSTQIVIVNVSQQIASAPNLLQRTGAFVSQGGTTLAAGTTQLLTEKSDLTDILRPSVAIASISWTSSVVTVQTSAAHGIPTGKVVQGTIAGVAPVGYNGTFACTGVDATHFTYPLVSNPGAETALGTFTLGAVAELASMGNTFFGQGNSQAVYVLELGVGTAADGVTALAAYLLAPTTVFYSYLLPREWDTETSAPTLFRQYESTTSKVYFYVTTTVDTYTAWTSLPTKSVFLGLESPDAPDAEFSLAADFYATLSANPGPASKVPPLAWRYVYGVTPLVLTPTQQTTYKAAGLNWITTGAEGGISQFTIANGQYGDKRPWNYWYAVDWVIVTISEALAAVVINGSNSVINPLYYNQPGINQLQKTAQSDMNSGVAFGLILGPVTVDAVPFATYVAENPNDYAAGLYAGLSATFTPARGFDQIMVNLVVSDIVA